MLLGRFTAQRVYIMERRILLEFRKEKKKNWMGFSVSQDHALGRK